MTKKNQFSASIEKIVEDVVKPRFDNVDRELKKLNDKFDSGFKKLEMAINKQTPPKP